VSGSITPPGGGAATPPPIQNFAQAIAQVTQIPAQLRNQVFAALQTMTLANALANGGMNVPMFANVRLNTPRTGGDSNISDTNTLSNDRSITNRNLLSGAGVAAGAAG
jgi:hypothetical protein